MDFNTQRKAVAAVEGFGKKHKIFYPLCVLAVLCITLFCSAVRAVDMALSDDDGHFLGMNRSHKKHRTAQKREGSSPVTAEKKGFFRRAVSALLAACFAVMVVPEGLEIVSFAAGSSHAAAVSGQLNVSSDTLQGFDPSIDISDYKNTLDVPAPDDIADKSWTKIAAHAFEGNAVISSIDLTGVSEIGEDAFKNAASLTRVIINGSDIVDSTTSSYFVNGDDPFEGIPEDAIIYIKNPGDKARLRRILGDDFFNNHSILYNDVTYPDDIESVTIGNAIDDLDSVLIKVKAKSASEGIQLYGYFNSQMPYKYEPIDCEFIQVPSSNYTYVTSIKKTDINKYASIAARAYNKTSFDGEEYTVCSKYFTCSDNPLTLVSTDPSNFTFHFSGSNADSYPILTWEQSVTGVTDCLFASPGGVFGRVNAPRTDLGTGSSHYYQSELTDAKYKVKDANGYPAYLFEIYAPFGAPDMTTTEFAEIAKSLVAIENGTSTGEQNKWHVKDYYYYRISGTQIKHDRFDSVIKESMKFLRNYDCDDVIEFTWNKVGPKNGVDPDGYVFYFDNYEPVYIKLTNNNPDYAVSPDSENATSVTFRYKLPEAVKSGTYKFNVYAYKYYPAASEDIRIQNGHGDRTEPSHEKEIQIERFSMTTESIKENEIILRWSFNKNDTTGYTKNDKNFTISYYTDKDPTVYSFDVADPGTDPDTGEYMCNAADYISISKDCLYTFTVKQNCTRDEEHFFSGSKVSAQSNTEPLKPEVTIKNGNREFSVAASSADPNVAGFHVRVYSKSGDQKVTLLHESYLPAVGGAAEERIQQFNKTQNLAAPENLTEYIVEVNAYSHSQHQNDNIYSALPDPYKTGTADALRYYPIEHEYPVPYTDPAAEEYYVTTLACPSNSIVLTVTWKNAPKPSERGALLTWYTISNSAQKYQISRRRIDELASDAEKQFTVIGYIETPAGVGKENTYVDSTAPFAIYKPDPSDPNGDVDYYAEFEYEVVAVYNDNTVDPLPAKATFQFKEAYASLSAPTDVKAVGQDGQITVTWVSVDAADRYYIYRDDDETPIIKLEADGKAGNTLTYVDHPMDNSTEHTYYITSVYSVADNDSNDPNLRKLVESVKVSADGISGERFLPVTGLTGSTVDGSITVKWDKHTDKNVEYYSLIATRVDDNGNPIDTKTYIVTGNTTYTISNLDNGDLYTFEVYAHKTVNNKDVQSEQGSTISIIVGMPIYPPNVEAKPGNRKVTLTWTPNPQSKTTDGYYISRYDPETGKYTLLASTAGTTYVDLNLENGRTYWYAVQSYKSVSWHTIVSDYSLPVQATPDAIYAEEGETDPYFIDSPPDFTVTSDDGTAHLSWTQVSGADGYRIYMLDKNGVPILLGTSTKNKIDYTGLINGEVYTYTVTAYRVLANGEIVESAYATPRSVTIGSYLAAPVDVTAVAGDGKVTLSWTAVTGATGYVVYAYNAAKNSFSAVGVVSKPGFVHEGLENGLTYSYMIAAYRTVGLSNQYSQYSLAVSATPTASADDTGSGSGSGSSSGGSSNGSGYNIAIVGTVPEGISHSELISAYSDDAAFSQDIEIRFSVNTDSSKAIYDVLSGYADGLDSFDVYPLDISAYVAGTNTKVQPAAGHYVMITMPVPDSFRKYDNDFQVIHINSSGQMEVLALNYGESDGIPLVQFSVSEFSPFAFVHYYTPQDLESRSGASAAGAAGTSAAGSVYALRSTGGAGYSLRKRNRVYKLIKK
ncbi:MAG: fibronectin type III domain-containing protein [Oscillospiraceae bacterium]|nr:fibronectin type III domain-containing protein [Oscillospiraceae bacterium]